MNPDWSSRICSLTSGGKQCRDLLEILLYTFDHLNRVRAGLSSDLKGDSGLAVHARRTAGFLRAVFRIAKIPDSNRRSIDRGDDEVVEVARVNETSHRSQILFSVAGCDAAAGNVGVLAHDGIAHGVDRQTVRGKPVRIDPNVDGSFHAAIDPDGSHTGTALDLFLDDLVCDLCQFTYRPVADECNGKGRGLIAVELLNCRGQNIGWQIPHDRAHAIAHVLSGRLDVAIQIERNDDIGRAVS